MDSSGLGRAFEGVFLILFLAGIAAGIALCGLGWLIWWLVQHIDVSWV